MSDESFLAWAALWCWLNLPQGRAEGHSWQCVMNQWFTSLLCPKWLGAHRTTTLAPNSNAVTESCVPLLR